MLLVVSVAVLTRIGVHSVTKSVLFKMGKCAVAMVPALLKMEPVFVTLVMKSSIQRLESVSQSNARQTVSWGTANVTIRSMFPSATVQKLQQEMIVQPVSAKTVGLAIH